MSEKSLSAQLATHEENHDQHEFAKQVDAEAQSAERDDVIAFIDRRAALLNARGQVGDTFRVDELYRLHSDIKAGKHVRSGAN